MLIQQSQQGIAETALTCQKACAASSERPTRQWRCNGATFEQGILAQAMLEAGERERLIKLTKPAIALQTPDGRMGLVARGGEGEDGFFQIRARRVQRAGF